MDINYIKSNFSKLGPDHLYRFLMDIITRGEFDSVDNFNVNTKYVRGSKVYVNDNGVHHIYECIVDVSTDGVFIEDEWADIIDVFRGMNGEDILNKMFITEELFNAETQVNEIEIQYDGFDPLLCKIILFHSIQGRLSETEFTIENNIIKLNELVMNPGEYMIIDIYEYDNKIHSDLLSPKGYVFINFVDLNNIQLRNPVTYMGDVGSLCDVYPAIIDGYELIGVDGEVDGIFDVDPKTVTFSYKLK